MHNVVLTINIAQITSNCRPSFTACPSLITRIWQLMSASFNLSGHNVRCRSAECPPAMPRTSAHLLTDTDRRSCDSSDGDTCRNIHIHVAVRVMSLQRCGRQTTMPGNSIIETRWNQLFCIIFNEKRSAEAFDMRWADPAVPKFSCVGATTCSAVPETLRFDQPQLGPIHTQQSRRLTMLSQ